MSAILFTGKKVLGKMLMPLPLGFLILAIGLFAYARGSRRIAKYLMIFVLCTWYILSLYPVAHWVISPLEYKYPKYTSEPIELVLVLGGYHASDHRIPVSSLLSQTSLMRLSEGIRIYRKNVGSKLLLSGYKFNDQISNAAAMAKVAHEFGVPRSDIVLESSPKDTAEEAKVWATHVRNKRFALVTSASHMPRAVALFENHKLHPIPAPTAYLSSGEKDLQWDSWVPSAGALKMVELAWHEYLGMFWAKFRNKV